MPTTRRAIVQIEVEGGAMPAHRWLPESGSGPGLLLLQEIFGISDYIERRAGDLANAGFVVLAPEIFWRLGQTRVENGPAALDQAMGLVSQVDWPLAVSDSVAASEALTRLTEVSGRVMIVGFCFGGGLAFNTAAESDPDGLVSYYGSALPDLLDLAPRVTCPQLHHFGESDSFVPMEEIRKIEEAVSGPQTEFYTYPDADHAFDNDDFHLHHAGASALAWERTLDFLQRRS